ncbi:MAG: Na(+)-translocating NADH-quinone reductase subunit A [Saprospiraceae bacterium]|nr:Na(+)-translocating NADH-quinone reductase subunit A [Saprospiraceae bacterium]
MKLVKGRLTVILSLLFFSQFSFAQSGGNNNYLLISLVAVGVVILVFAILSLADNLMHIEGKKAGIDSKKTNIGIFPRISDFFAKKAPNYVVDGAGYYPTTKGHNLKLAGKPTGDIKTIHTNRYALKPTDFNGISPIPKVVVEVGSEVKAGDPLFYDKKRPEIMYCAPVSGEVVEVKRGAKRAIAEIIILADKEISYREYEVPNLEKVDRQELKSFLTKSGVWPMLNQRPFDIVASIDEDPRDIFISTFNTAPLALDSNLVIAGNENAFQKGCDVLNALTDGSVYLGLDARGDAPSKGFSDVTGVKKNYFSGKHPVGNVGVQMHHVNPIKGNDKVWSVGLQDVITIGKLFLEGKFDASRLVSLGGSQVSTPSVIRTYQGASIGDLVEGNLSDEKNRIIAGDVYTGKESTTENFIGYKDDQLTVIKEGDKYEAFGWLLPITPRPSISGTFPNFLFPDFEFEGETNTHGEKRAFVVTGQYESVLPMDIYPQHLMKAILAGDFEKMEGLGINELSEEDIALCEFVCTSKMPLQKILRDGLEMMREQA